MGLDPGMDHMSAVELIERAHALGGVVTSFTSNCGGLPSPEVHASAQHGATPLPLPTGGDDYPLRPKHANAHYGAPSPPSPHRWRRLPPSATSSRGRPRVSPHHGAPSPPSPSRGCPRVSSPRLATTRARVHASAHHGAARSPLPTGVIAATRNDARYRERGRVVSVAGGAPLLAAATPLTSGRLGRTLRLEVIPNRDSLPYARLYGIEHEAQTVSRGTLRYQGWCALFGTFDAMGLSSAKAAATPVPAGLTTWSELLSSLGVHPPKAHSAASSSSSSSTSSTSSASSSAAAASAASEGASEGASERAVRSALSSLGVWSAEGEAIGQHASIADAFCALLSRKLSYGPQESAC